MLNNEVKKTGALYFVEKMYLSNVVNDVSDIINFHKRFTTYNDKTFYIANKIPCDASGIMVLHVDCICGKAMPVSFEIFNGLGTPTPDSYCCSSCQAVFNDKYLAVAEYGIVTEMEPFFCFISDDNPVSINPTSELNNN